MRINLTPQRRGDTLTLSREGDTLTINGTAFDFSQLEDGDLLPRDAVDCEFLASDVERIDGHVTLTLIAPHGMNASEAARFPQPILDPPDGPVEVPA